MEETGERVLALCVLSVGRYIGTLQDMPRQSLKCTRSSKSVARNSKLLCILGSVLNFHASEIQVDVLQHCQFVLSVHCTPSAGAFFGLKVLDNCSNWNQGDCSGFMTSSWNFVTE